MTFQRVWVTHPDTRHRSGRFELRSRDGGLSLIEDGVAEARWAQPRAEVEGSPQAVWVSDRGWSAVLFGHDQLVLIDPTGARTNSVNALKLLREDPASKPFINWTTAGEYWDTAPCGSFFAVEGETRFALRCYWSRRVLLAPGADPRIEPTPAEVAPLRAAELAAARGFIEELLRLDPPGEGEDEMPYLRAQVRAQAGVAILGLELQDQPDPALHSAACDAILRVLSRPAHPSMWTSIRDVSQAGELRRLSYAQDSLRLACNDALVRLGRDPAPASGYGLAWTDAGSTFPDRPADHVRALYALAEGQTHAEVYARVGAPDLIEFHRGTWIYDTATSTRTLRFSGGAVAEIRDDSERAWLRDGSREQHRNR